MHGDTTLLVTLVLALAAALAGGLAIGPFTPGFAGDAHAMQQLAEVGVMFMMFGTGLHFSFKDLAQVKSMAVPGAIAQIALGTASGAASPPGGSSWRTSRPS